MRPPEIYKSKFGETDTKDGWLEYGISWTSGVYSFSIDMTFYREEKKLSGFDLRFSLIGFDSFVRWTRSMRRDSIK